MFERFLKHIAAYFWKEELSRNARLIKVAEEALATKDARIRELESMQPSKPGRLDFYVRESIREWEKISGLVKTDAFRSLVYFLNAEIENNLLLIANRDDTHKFWYIQGCKSVIRDLLDFSIIVSKKVAFLMQNQIPNQGKTADTQSAPSYQ
jgi:hypothetical protein